MGSAAATDASGSAVLSGLAVGTTYTVYATYGGTTGTSSPVTVIKDIAVPAATSVSLDIAGGSATVTVVNAASSPVSGATVTATLNGTTTVMAPKGIIDTLFGVKSAYAGSSSFSVSATTDTSGVAAFTNLPAGTYTFTATEGSRSMTSEAVSVADTKTSVEMIMLPTSGGNIMVTVKDGSGAALSDAGVTVLSGASTVATGTTNANGIALIGGIVAGSYTVTAAKTGYTSNTAVSAVDVSEGKTSTGTVTLTRQTGGAAVQVTFSDGATKVDPAFYIDNSQSATAYTSKTGSNGVYTYTFAGLTTGSHSVAAQASNYTSSGSVNVTATTGTPTAGAITLTRQTGSVAVTVTFSDGATNVTPSFYVDGSQTAYTNVTMKTNPTSTGSGTSEGVYTLSDLTTNVTHTITVSTPGYTSSTETTTISVTPTTASMVTGAATLTRRHSVSSLFTVTSTHGSLLGGAVITLTDAQGNTASGTTAADGTATINTTGLTGTTAAYTVSFDSISANGTMTIDQPETVQLGMRWSYPLAPITGHVNGGGYLQATAGSYSVRAPLGNALYIELPCVKMTVGNILCQEPLRSPFTGTNR